MQLYSSSDSKLTDNTSDTETITPTHERIVTF